MRDPSRPCSERTRPAGNTQADPPEDSPLADNPPAKLPVKPSRIDIAERVSRMHRDLDACVRGTGFEGTAYVELAIAPSGRVNGASPNGASPEIHLCVEQVLRRTRFPASEEGIELSYPLSLRGRRRRPRRN